MTGLTKRKAQNITWYNLRNTIGLPAKPNHAIWLVCNYSVYGKSSLVTLLILQQLRNHYQELYINAWDALQRVGNGEGIKWANLFTLHLSSTMQRLFNALDYSLIYTRLLVNLLGRILLLMLPIWDWMPQLLWTMSEPGLWPRLGYRLMPTTTC